MTVPAIRMKLRCRGRRRYIHIRPGHVVVAENRTLGLTKRATLHIHVLHDGDDDGDDDPIVTTTDITTWITITYLGYKTPTTTTPTTRATRPQATNDSESELIHPTPYAYLLLTTYIYHTCSMAQAYEL